VAVYAFAWPLSLGGGPQLTLTANRVIRICPVGILRAARMAARIRSRTRFDGRLRLALQVSFHGRGAFASRTAEPTLG
jgi:hypothetical protein